MLIHTAERPAVVHERCSRIGGRWGSAAPTRLSAAAQRNGSEKGEPALSDVTMPVTGGCQCGFVRYELTGKPLPIVICHCKECQKQTSSAFGMTLPAFRRDFKLLSGTLKEWRRLADSGREVVCYFCPDCGTRLYHSSSLGPDYLHLKPGTLDDTSWLEPVAQVWTKSVQPWLKLANELVSYPGQPDSIAALIKR